MLWKNFAGERVVVLPYLCNECIFVLIANFLVVRNTLAIVCKHDWNAGCRKYFIERCVWVHQFLTFVRVGPSWIYLANDGLKLFP